MSSTDPEATNTVVSVTSLMAARDQTTIAAYRQMTSSASLPACCPPAGRDGAEAGGTVPRREHQPRAVRERCRATSLGALVADGGIEKGLAALTEADRVARFGFTQTELDRFRLGYTQAFAQLAASNDEHTSVSLADEYIRNFMQQEPIPGIAYENGLVQRFMPEIPSRTSTRSRASGCRIATAWSRSPRRRSRGGGSGRGEAGGRHQERWRRPADGLRGHGEQQAAARGDAQARRISTTATKPAGITEWTLSNGVRVVLDPTTFKQDEVLFRAFSPGGTLASDQDFVAGPPTESWPKAASARSQPSIWARSWRARSRSCARHRRDVRRPAGRALGISKRCSS